MSLPRNPNLVTSHPRFCNSVVSVTSTVVVTEVSTFFEEVVTVTVPMTATASAPGPTFKRKAKRSVEYPEWLDPTYSPERVSSACQCLSIAAPSQTTVTATAQAVTVTDDATVTETTTSTLTTDLGVVTQTVWTTVTPTPAPSAVPVRAMIAVYRKSSGAKVGYVYMSSGPAITTDPTLAVVVAFTLPAGETPAKALRLLPEGYSPAALGFNCLNTQELRNFYGGVTADTPSKPLRSSVPLMVTDKVSQHHRAHFRCRPLATTFTKRILYVSDLNRM